MLHDPVFLHLDEVLEIHRDQIERYGGTLGIREPELLQSAVSTPATQFGGQFLHRDIYEMAAAYLFHITQNRPFLDGNKRTGAVTALVFLGLNGIEIDAAEDDFEQLVRSVAQGQSDKPEIAEFLRKHTA